MKSYKYKVAAFYKFIELKGLTEWQKIFSSFLASENIKGTVLLANEGVNGTVAGQCESIENFRTFLDANKLLSEKNYKTSFCDEEPFPRLKVKLKKEIVSIGNSEANPNANVGIYVQPEEWNNLIADKDVFVKSGDLLTQVSTHRTDTTYNQHTIDTPHALFTGDLEVYGDLIVHGNITVCGSTGIRVPNGDVKAGSVSLKNHTHGGVETGVNKTDPP